jgi:ABC-type polar amino acid transport system ATPase subunit
MDPKIMLFDEITWALDPELMSRLMFRDILMLVAWLRAPPAPA